MGFLTKPQTTTVDPTPDAVKPLQGDIAGFLQGLFSDPSSSPFGGLTSDLQRGALGGIQQLLSANPEQQTFDQLSPGLLDIFSRDANGVSEAAFPLFQRGLQEGLGAISNAAPGRFSTTFARQGVDFSTRALQDFNLLQQQAFQQNVANQLGAAGLLGSLASQAGGGAFGRNLQAGQLGLAATQANVNPVVQLLLGGLGFGQPSPKETIVGKSPLDVAGDIGGGLVGISSAGGFGNILGGLF